MTRAQRITLRLSEVRQRLNEIAGLEGDDFTEEIRAEAEKLQTEYSDLEVRHRAAIVAEGEPTTKPTPDGEEKEVRELLGRANVGEYAAAAADQRVPAGAEAELNAALKMRAGEFPLRLLAPEVRATTDAEANASQQGWLDRLFTETAAMFMGVSFRSVPPGMAAFPVTTAGGTAAQRGRGEATADAPWTVGVTDLKPSRNSVRGVYSMEDAARLPGLEDALRRDFAMASADAVDAAIFLGDAGANEDPADVTGLASVAGVTEQTITQANKGDASAILNAFLALVDGKAAQSLEDLRTVLALGAFRDWSSSFPIEGTDSLLSAIVESAGLRYRVRAGIGADTSANSWAAFIGRGRGIDGAGVAAVWEAARFVVDPYSRASEGEVALTLHVLWAFGVPRPANFARLKYVA